MILSCGEALIDMLPCRSTAGAPGFVPHPGGAVLNTAIALGRLGIPSAFLSGLSSDFFGEMLLAALAASHVDTSLAIRSARPTTLAFVRFEDGQPRYAFYDENSAGRMILPSDLPELPGHIRALFFGGISLVADPGGATYEALMAREAGSGRVQMLDPNIRPSVIADAAGHRARLRRMIAMADVVKLSDEDLRWLSGGGAVADLARVLLDQGPRLVFVTEGAKGAQGFTRTHSAFVPAPKVQVADTVGAGDTFNAGILAALHRTGLLTPDGIAALSEPALTEALTLGVRAAAITVSRPGADPPWEKELSRCVS